MVVARFETETECEAFLTHWDIIKMVSTTEYDFAFAEKKWKWTFMWYGKGKQSEYAIVACRSRKGYYWITTLKDVQKKIHRHTSKFSIAKCIEVIEVFWNRQKPLRSLSSSTRPLLGVRDCFGPTYNVINRKSVLCFQYYPRYWRL